MLNKEQHEEAAENEYNFDHPDAFDFDLVISTLKRLRVGKSVQVPIYNFTTHKRDKHKVGEQIERDILNHMKQWPN